MKKERINLVGVVCFGVLLLLIFTGIKQFTLNQQAWDIWHGAGHDPLGFLFSGSPHGVRYLVYYPVFTIAQFLSVPPDIVFSYSCALVLFFMIVFLRRIVSGLWGYHGYVVRRDFVTFGLFAVSFAMNGRILWAFFAYILVIFVGVDWFRHTRWKASYVILLIFACLAASVSSGTLFLVMAMIAGIGFVTLVRSPRLLVSTPQMPLSLIFILILFAIPTIAGVVKNLDFYGGDRAAVLRMLQHGAGAAIVESLGAVETQEPSPAQGAGRKIVIAVYAIAGASVLLGVSVFGIYRGWRPGHALLRATPAENVVYLAIVLALVAGLYGYSVLTLAAVPTLILISGYGPDLFRHVRSQLGSITGYVLGKLKRRV